MATLARIFIYLFFILISCFRKTLPKVMERAERESINHRFISSIMGGYRLGK